MSALLDSALDEERRRQCEEGDLRLKNTIVYGTSHPEAYDDLPRPSAGRLIRHGQATMLVYSAEQMRAYRAEGVATERKRIESLLSAIREHWVLVNGAESVCVAVLDRITEVVADGSFVAPKTQEN